MVSENFSASGPRGPVIGSVTLIMGEGSAVGYVPPQSMRRLENKPVVGIHVTTFRNILASLVRRNPSNTKKRNNVLK